MISCDHRHADAKVWFIHQNLSSVLGHNTTVWVSCNKRDNDRNTIKRLEVCLNESGLQLQLLQNPLHHLCEGTPDLRACLIIQHINFLMMGDEFLNSGDKCA